MDGKGFEDKIMRKIIKKIMFYMIRERTRRYNSLFQVYEGLLHERRGGRTYPLWLLSAGLESVGGNQKVYM